VTCANYATEIYQWVGFNIATSSFMGWFFVLCGGAQMMEWANAKHRRQGLTLVRFSAQLEPCLTHKNTLHTLNTPPKHPLNTGYTIPTRTPYPIKIAQVELRRERV